MKRNVKLIAIAVAALSGCFSEAPAVGGGSESTTDGSEEEAGTDGPGQTSLAPVTTAESSAVSTGTADFGPTDGAETDGTSGTGDEGTDDGSSSSSSSTTGVPSNGPYEDCYPGDVGGPKLCPEMSCVVSLPAHSACAPNCDTGCDPGIDGAGTVCLSDVADGVAAPVCFMMCAGVGASCPDGTACSEMTYTQGGEPIWGCLWP